MKGYEITGKDQNFALRFQWMGVDVCFVLLKFQVEIRTILDGHINAKFTHLYDQMVVKAINMIVKTLSKKGNKRGGMQCPPLLLAPFFKLP